MFFLFEFSLGDDDEHLGSVQRSAAQLGRRIPVPTMSATTRRSPCSNGYFRFLRAVAANEALAACGRLMMYENEHSLLNAMEFPRTA